jgi:hypothetical protein
MADLSLESVESILSLGNVFDPARFFRSGLDALPPAHVSPIERITAAARL